MSAVVPELKATLHLAANRLPHEGNLPHNEPLRLARWAELGLYSELRKAGRGRPLTCSMTARPNANGPIHLGHALNKGLKDFVVKSKTMAGFDLPTSPDTTATASPSKSKSTSSWAAKNAKCPSPRPRGLPAPTPRVR